jgi:UDP-N-acetylglucosamine 2-epimerase (non-hydrolysing)
MICMVVGARPNFVKMAPLVLEARKRGLAHLFVHTGQHSDPRMSTDFLKDLGLPVPDVHLEVAAEVTAGSHAEQTARIMVGFEQVCLSQKPRIVVVGGDVNSTIACALAATKLLIPVAHVEAGLRSRDRSMPEETNRILTDHIACLHFTTEAGATDNLVQEGIPLQSIHFVGNTMIDSLITHLDRALALAPWLAYGLEPRRYGIVTLHRPGNVDSIETLSEIARALREVARDIPLLFPVHHRTRRRLSESPVDLGPIRLVEPLGYLEFLGLMARAGVVLTDSGGIQEETTALGVPCVTLRENTERPVTLVQGTNRLAGLNSQEIIRAAREGLEAGFKPGSPPLWDGRAAGRIMDVLQMFSPDPQGA